MSIINFITLYIICDAQVVALVENKTILCVLIFETVYKTLRQILRITIISMK